jgi:hypothetical protein
MDLANPLTISGHYSRQDTAVGDRLKTRSLGDAWTLLNLQTFVWAVAWVETLHDSHVLITDICISLDLI